MLLPVRHFDDGLRKGEMRIAWSACGRYRLRRDTDGWDPRVTPDPDRVTCYYCLLHIRRYY